MRVRVRYTTTSDGARIAFTAEGAGHPLLYMPPIPLRHVELEWQLPEDRRWLERLGQGRQLIRYDPRGMGLSERGIGDCTLDALVRDLSAVVDAVGTAPVALFACVNTAPIAVGYAVRHPERVSHLVLWCGVARMADAISPQMITLLELAEKDWSLFTEATAHQMVGWSAGEAAHRYADFLRACLDPAVGRALVDGLRVVDVTDVLPAVAVPTLVLHRRDVDSIPVARSSELAARIPGARLVILEGAVMRPGAGDVDAAARAVDEFIGDLETTSASDGGRSAAAADAPNVFRREGEYWTLAFEGRVCRVRDLKGLHHIARLLREPGLELAPAELIADLDPAPGETSRRSTGGRNTSSLGDAGPLLDAKAKAHYRSRLSELRAELDDAERCNDVERAARARAELEFITHELAAAVGLGGRDRRASAAAERARVTVTKRIKDALARVRASHPSLARHLAQTIRTGQLCAYGTDPDRRVPWSL